jgi:Protein of unknown function (DUF3606)
MGGHWTLRAPADYRFVDLQDPAEAEYWLLVLDTSRHTLEHALASVGNHVVAVRGYLDHRGQERQPSAT